MLLIWIDQRKFFWFGSFGKLGVEFGLLFSLFGVAFGFVFGLDGLALGFVFGLDGLELGFLFGLDGVQINFEYGTNLELGCFSRQIHEQAGDHMDIAERL